MIDTAEAGVAHPLLALSDSGVRHAARLRHLTEAELAQRIYAFHRLPIGGVNVAPSDWTGVRDWLGFGSGTDCSRCLDRDFVMSADPAGYWMHWRRPTAVGTLAHKLYVSPRPEVLPDVFPRVADTFSGLDVPAFKIGAHARVLLRPEKIVAYFSSRDHMMAVAEELSPLMATIPVHGVPFTSPLSVSGILSWGVDPAHDGESWRLWIARLLARAIALAEEKTVDEIVHGVHMRLRAAGVDPERWEPILDHVP